MKKTLNHLGDRECYLDGFKPAWPVLVVIDDGLVLTDSLTASTLTDHVLQHTFHETADYDTRMKSRGKQQTVDMTGCREGNYVQKRCPQITVVITQ